MGLDAPWHWIVLAIVVIALFGYKKLPDAARSLGRSLRIFKAEIKGMSEDDAARAAHQAEVVPPSLPAADPAPTEASRQAAEVPANTTSPTDPAQKPGG